MTATVREAGARERYIKGKLTEITDPTMHNPNNYLTVLTETEWFFTVSSELWKPKSVETICLLKKINIKKYFWPNREIFLGLRGGGERHTRTTVSHSLDHDRVMETGKSKSVETICLLKQINILMIFAKFAALKIYFWPIAKLKSSKMHAFPFCKEM